MNFIHELSKTEVQEVEALKVKLGARWRAARDAAEAKVAEATTAVVAERQVVQEKLTDLRAHDRAARDDPSLVTDGAWLTARQGKLAALRAAERKEREGEVAVSVATRQARMAREAGLGEYDRSGLVRSLAARGIRI